MRLLSVLSRYSASARVLALRELLCNSIFNEPAQYFGAKVNHEQKNENSLLLNQNHKQGTSAMLAQKHSSVFHAGVIGQGPRKPPPENSLDKETIALNSTLLVDAIKVNIEKKKTQGNSILAIRPLKLFDSFAGLLQQRRARTLSSESGRHDDGQSFAC